MKATRRFVISGVLFPAMMFIGALPMYAAGLPVCSNEVVISVIKRAGCAVGDARCWLSAGGYCTDHTLNKIGRTKGREAEQWVRIRPAEVRAGDVARFLAFAHVAFVEQVNYDSNGAPVSVNVSEYNFGDCWVDQANMVTNMFKKVGYRSALPLKNVDGGFWRVN